MARIVSLGSALQDIYLIDREDFSASAFGPESIFGELHIGSKVDIDQIHYRVGGGGTNSAVEFARHGHESILLANIGRDPAGDAVLARLDEENVDTSYLSYTRRHTGCSIILLDAKTGERTILTHRGASAKFDNLHEDDLDLIQPDWIYITNLRGDLETLRLFIKKAKSIGTKVMLNPGAAELSEKRHLLRFISDVDILLLNQYEAKRLVPGELLVEQLAHLSAYVSMVILTAGSTGGIATDGSEIFRFGLYEDVPVKDTTGAGDSFGSGFLAHLAADFSFKDSIIYASANSTSVVTYLGAQPCLLTGKEDLHPMPIQLL